MKRRDYGERRIWVVGEVDGEILFVVYTPRDDKRRLISARRANANERKALTRVSLEDLDEMESLTDRERVRNMTDEEIAEAAASDPDTVHPDDPWWRRQLERGGVLVPPGVRKKRVVLHLDEDVLAWFRRRGSGWQHSVNHALRRYMQDVERDRKFEEKEKESAAE